MNISSLAGKIGFPYQMPYEATKAGFNMFTPFGRNLQTYRSGVSLICPGYVDDFGKVLSFTKHSPAGTQTIREKNGLWFLPAEIQPAGLIAAPAS